MTIPGWSLVTALNSLQKPMMLTPCWPSAGPTGGDGFAFPAGICSLIVVTTFLAMMLRLLYLDEVELDRRGAPEDRHQHADLRLVRIDAVDHAVEVRERPVDDAD